MIANTITVKFQGVEVGVLSYVSGDGYATFQYYPDWAMNGFAIDPINMPLSNEPYKFTGIDRDVFRGLPAVFADSLPDDFGNAVINQWLASQGNSIEDFGPLDRLLYIGNRGMGGLEYEPAVDTESNQPVQLQISSLVEMAQEVLNDRTDLRMDLKHDDAMYQLCQIGTSAGGARAKAVIAINDDMSEVRSGQVDVPEGFEHYLIKFDGVNPKNKNDQGFGAAMSFGIMEYAYHVMAIACGIDMMHCDLFEENGRSHFVTKRFDRASNQKYHTLSLCGIAHASFRKIGQYSYEEFLSIARELDLTHSEQVQIFTRMAFNVIARNQDDHTKNFSFLVNDDLEWQLAPAFDIAFSYDPSSQWVAKHAMPINGKRDNFARDDLLSVAKLITGFRVAQSNMKLFKTIAVVSKWETYANEYGVAEKLTALVAKNLRLKI
jgi:serine/threonine-protein kinase HipA